MDDCLFCKLVAKAIPAHIVYEDDDALAFLDVKPVNVGHTLIVPKAHHADFAATPDELISKLTVLAKRVAAAAVAAVGADGFNIGVNAGAAAGQVIFHTHIHVMPRFTNDGHQHWAKKQVAEGEMSRVAGEIRQRL
jgi:histidine triad (HIT) family protein